MENYKGDDNQELKELIANNPELAEKAFHELWLKKTDEADFWSEKEKANVKQKIDACFPWDECANGKDE